MADFSPNDTTNESQGKEALKPCPFCGFAGDSIYTSCEDLETGTVRHYCYCPSCSCEGPGVFLSERVKYPAGEKCARILWNTRAGGDA